MCNQSAMCIHSGNHHKMYSSCPSVYLLINVPCVWSHDLLDTNTIIPTVNSYKLHHSLSSQLVSIISLLNNNYLCLLSFMCWKLSDCLVLLRLLIIMNIIKINKPVILSCPITLPELSLENIYVTM